MLRKKLHKLPLFILQNCLYCATYNLINIFVFYLLILKMKFEFLIKNIVPYMYGFFINIYLKDYIYMYIYVGTEYNTILLQLDYI